MEVKITKAVIEALEPRSKPYDVPDTQIKGFHLRVYPTGKVSFYYTYRNIARKRKRILIGVYGPSKTADQARQEAKDYSSQVSKGIDVQAEKSKNQQEAIALRDKTLENFIDNHYETWAVANQKRGQETVDSVKSAFADFLKLPLPEINTSLVEKWRIKRKKKGRKASTINRNVNALKGVLSRAVEWEVIKEHPFKKVKDLKVDKSPNVRYLTEEETEQLLAALAERDEEIKQARERGNAHRKQRGYELMPCLVDLAYADRMTPLIILALKTGMRRGELFDLRWQEVNFSTKQITVLGDNAKSNHTRHIPLNPTALNTLKKWKKQTSKPKPDCRVFPADDGGRLDNVKKSWASILDKADISQFRWHDMRHDFASQLVMKGVPLNTVRELCGHASMDTTLRYAHLAPGHKTEAVALLG